LKCSLLILMDSLVKRQTEVLSSSDLLRIK